MTQLTFGNHPYLVFSSEQEKYESIGYLAQKQGLDIRREDNQEQGAWGAEYRIYLYEDLGNATQALINKASAGVGNVVSRINCNEFINLLLDQHGFSMGSTQDVNAIRQTIPRAFVGNFDLGVAVA
jgi:hypothetical protein